MDFSWSFLAQRKATAGSLGEPFYELLLVPTVSRLPSPTQPQEPIASWENYDVDNTYKV